MVSDFVIEAADRERLLAIARRAIASDLGVESPRVDDSGGTLDACCGVFVTVNVRGRLRGCIGTIEGDRPLGTEVAAMARAAAFGDPRFKPIEARDLDDLSIEVSVMSPLRSITGPGDVTIGRDGLVVERGVNRGLLLPQVASERGWDAETFLAYTCDKAGLTPEAWRDDDTQLFAFSATVLSEDD